MGTEELVLDDAPTQATGPTPNLLRRLELHRVEVERLRAEGIDPNAEWRRFAERFDPAALRKVVAAFLEGEDTGAPVDEIADQQ